MAVTSVLRHRQYPYDAADVHRSSASGMPACLDFVVYIGLSLVEYRCGYMRTSSGSFCAKSTSPGGTDSIGSIVSCSPTLAGQPGCSTARLLWTMYCDGGMHLSAEAIIFLRGSYASLASHLISACREEAIGPVILVVGMVSSSSGFPSCIRYTRIGRPSSLS